MIQLRPYIILATSTAALAVCIFLGSSHPGFITGFGEGIEIGTKLVIPAGIGAYIAIQSQQPSVEAG